LTPFVFVIYFILKTPFLGGDVGMTNFFCFEGAEKVFSEAVA